MDAGARHRYAELVEAPDSKGLLPLLSAATLRAPDVRLRLHRNGCCIHSALPFKWERLPAVWLLLLRLGRKWLSTHVHLISSSCHKRVFTHAPLSPSTHGRPAKRLFVRRYCAMETACHKFWNNGATPCGSLSKQTVVKQSRSNGCWCRSCLKWGSSLAPLLAAASRASAVVPVANLSITSWFLAPVVKASA